MQNEIGILACSNQSGCLQANKKQHMLMRDLGVRDGHAGGITIFHCKNVAESSHYEVSRESSFTKCPEDSTPYRHSPSNHQRQHGIKTHVPVIFVEAVIAKP